MMGVLTHVAVAACTTPACTDAVGLAANKALADTLVAMATMSGSNMLTQVKSGTKSTAKSTRANVLDYLLFPASCKNLAFTIENMSYCQYNQYHGV